MLHGQPRRRLLATSGDAECSCASDARDYDARVCDGTHSERSPDS